MEEYCDVNKVYLKPINSKVAKDIIIKYHYTHKWTLCRIAYGIFYKTKESSLHFDDVVDKLIGCVIYSQPVGRSVSSSLSDLLSKNEVFELVRLFIHDGYGKNIESYCIAESFRQLNKDFPHIKAVVSYADSEVNHSGTIYQATGFLYQGNNSLCLMPNYSISLEGPPNYNWIHSRTVFSKWGSHNIEHLKKRIGKTFWRKKESSKHRYIKFIANKILNKKLKKSLKHPILPYPKSSTYSEEIQIFDVENNINDSFFT